MAVLSSVERYSPLACDLAEVPPKYRLIVERNGPRWPGLAICGSAHLRS